MRRLRERLDRLEATLPSAQTNLESEFDFSLLSVEELRFVLMIGDLCNKSGEQAVTPEQLDQLAEILSKACRN